MQLNEIHENHEHASTSLKVLLLVFALVLVGTLGYLVWDSNRTADTTDYSTTPLAKDKTANQEKIQAVEALNCGDAKLYGFSMTFGAKWAGYKIKEVQSDDAVITCHFTMPTTSTDEVWTTAAADHDAGYASIFAVSVYTPTQWTVAKAEANTPTELESNVNYVWAWLPSQAYPDDLAEVAADDNNVVATFTLAN